MKNDKSLNYIRRDNLLNSLSLCDSDSERIRLLVEKVIVLENQVEEMQTIHSEFLVRFNSFDIF